MQQLTGSRLVAGTALGRRFASQVSGPAALLGSLRRLLRAEPLGGRAQLAFSPQRLRGGAEAQEARDCESDLEGGGRGGQEEAAALARQTRGPADPEGPDLELRGRFP